MEKHYKLILNPVENLPYLIAEHPPEELHGLYVSDKEKNEETIKASKIAFSGRQEENKKIRDIYCMWKQALNVRNFSMRLLSGLHAHIILFMGLGNIGDTVMLLPEEAGGHYSTKKILERLGYRVIDMVPDNQKCCVDMGKTIEKLHKERPDFLFVDRSEGIHYENFTPLLTQKEKLGFTAVFDASQYLTNILNAEFISPFDMGFDIMLSTLHKNFPGPQKALVCSREDNDAWLRVQSAMSDYVSSLHVETTYMAGSVLEQRTLLRKYSRLIIENSITLENELYRHGLPVVRKNPHLQATHHIWLNMSSAEQAYSFFKKMEACGFLVNYRKLPYDLGQGIRMGTSAATLQGLNQNNIPPLSELITALYKSEVNNELYMRCQQYITTLQPMRRI